MRSSRRYISVVLLGLLAVVPLLHAAHHHGPAQDMRSGGVSSQCAVCNSGMAFHASLASDCVGPAVAASIATALPPETAVYDAVAATTTDPRAPPRSLV